jgi:hypothetical protein
MTPVTSAVTDWPTTGEAGQDDSPGTVLLDDQRHSNLDHLQGHVPNPLVVASIRRIVANLPNRAMRSYLKRRSPATHSKAGPYRGAF